MRIVINKCFGGFGLSHEAIKKYLNLKGKKAFFYKQTKYHFQDGVEEYEKVHPMNDNYMFYVVTKDLGEIINSLPDKYYFSYYDIKRDDKDLVKVVSDLGEKADGDNAKLAIVDVPDGIKWTMEEYDGIEHIAEEHETWG